MSARMNHFAVGGPSMKAMLDLSAVAEGQGLDFKLVELVKVRASQINGCAYCIQMHTEAGRKGGEREERYYLLNAWRESDLYSDKERAALAWTETLTLLSQKGVSDEDYTAVRAHFSEEELVKLTLIIVTINGWNRFGVAFTPVYDSKDFEA